MNLPETITYIKTQIQTIKANIITELQGKGVEVTSSIPLSQVPELIESINVSSGGDGGTSSTPKIIIEYWSLEDV